MGGVCGVLTVVVIWVVAVVMMPGCVLWWVYFGGALVLGLLCAWCYGRGGLMMRGFVEVVGWCSVLVLIWWLACAAILCGYVSLDG